MAHFKLLTISIWDFADRLVLRLTNSDLILNYKMYHEILSDKYIYLVRYLPG